MPEAKSKDQYNTTEVSQTFASPSGGDTVTHTTEVDGQLSEVDISADSAVVITITEVDNVGDAPDRQLRSYVGSEIDRFDFANGIAEVGAEREIVAEITDVQSATAVSINFTVDEYKA
mgnify:CR=1 FL=1